MPTTEDGVEVISSAPTLEQIQDFLADEVQFQPFGQVTWEFEAEQAENGDLMLSVIDRFARNTRDYDFDAEFDDWTLLDAAEQTFTFTYDWPDTWERLRKHVAHESLEWLRIERKMPFDHHEHDVVVQIW